MSSQPPREWAPRLWQGVDFFAWLKLLARNRFAVEPKYAYIAGIASAISLTHTGLRWLQHGRYGDELLAMPTPKEPIFVLGHWRTGTTLLHELLMLDDRHTAPDTTQCFVPTAPLITRDFFKKYLPFLMPGKRPMDNMPAGWDRPQEDEFALCLLGQPSPYADVAFPNHGPVHEGSLDLSGLTPRELKDWKRTLLTFVKLVHRADPRRIVLKSPPHTARVPVLLDLFPDAKFVHIVRNPFVVYASTVNLWNNFARRHGLQKPRRPELVEEKVIKEFRTVHERYTEAKHLIPAGRLIEVRYEDVTKDLVSATRRIYDGLNLGDFAGVEPAVRAYVDSSSSYETNKYPITDGVREMVQREWGDIIKAQGY